jgi:hypothetical protein
VDASAGRGRRRGRKPGPGVGSPGPRPEPGSADRSYVALRQDRTLARPRGVQPRSRAGVARAPPGPGTGPTLAAQPRLPPLMLPQRLPLPPLLMLPPSRVLEGLRGLGQHAASTYTCLNSVSASLVTRPGEQGRQGLRHPPPRSRPGLSAPGGCHIEACVLGGSAAARAGAVSMFTWTCSVGAADDELQLGQWIGS